MDVHPAALDAAPARAAPMAHGADARRTALLLGQPTLREYLDFVREDVLGGETADQRALCDEWRAANDYYGELERDEAGLADGAGCHDLDPAFVPFAQRVMDDPAIRRSFDTLPTRVALVELDRLVVYQTRVDQDFVEALQARLGPEPDAQALVRFCLPLPGRDRDAPPLRVRKIGSRRYSFTSASSDVRFHDAVLLDPARLGEHDGGGPVGGALGLLVGFGSNLLNVVRSDGDGRMLLNNGYHRACALRALGVTHAPCVVQTVTRRDELALTAPSRVIETPAFYFKSARPPLLKDFFDPRIRKVVPVRRVKHVIELSFEVKEYDVED